MKSKFQRVSKLDLFLESVRRTMKRFSTSSSSLGVAFLLGRMVNSSSTSTTLTQLVREIFSISYSRLNLLSWVAIVLILIPFIEKGLSIYLRKQKYVTLLAKFLADETDPWLKPFIRGTLGIDSNISLQDAPDLHEGWKLDEINVHCDPGEASFPASLVEVYKNYYSTDDEDEGFSRHDGTKFMLRENPRSSTDEPNLTLNLQRTKYSYCRFYNTQIASLRTERTKKVSEALQNKINFHHIFAMTAVVITSNEKILIIHRSHKVRLNPNTWSLSIDEQFSREDSSSVHPILNLSKRVLLEELGVLETDYDLHKFRALSIFLVGNELNICVLTELPIELTDTELDHRMSIRWTSKKDPEIDDWKFVSYSDLAKELAQSPEGRISTYRYILLVTLARHLGMPRVAKTLFDARS